MFLIEVSPYVLGKATRIMLLDPNTLLAVSLTVNGCVLIYCLCLKGQAYLARKCCCDSYNVLIVLSQVFEDKPWLLAKRVTEQIVLLVTVILSVVAIITSEVLMSPFRCTATPNQKFLIEVTLSIYLGKYVYVIVQNVYLPKPANRARFRIDVVHHLTTIACYTVFVVTLENLLLALVGITMELNTSIIEVARTMKEVNGGKSSRYRKLSVVSCVLTSVFRGIIPSLSLVLCIIRETPFVMNYGSLTAFFVSLIFFSVINVWLILNAVQRLYNVYKHRPNLPTDQTCRNNGGNTRTECGNTQTDHIGVGKFIGYMPSYANWNIANVDEDKLNTTKKDFIKDSIKPSISLNFDNMSTISDNRSLQISMSPDERDEYFTNERFHASRIQNEFITSNGLRGSNSSSNSVISGDQMLSVLPGHSGIQFTNYTLQRSTDLSKMAQCAASKDDTSNMSTEEEEAGVSSDQLSDSDNEEIR